jgi:hypothetical protein
MEESMGNDHEYKGHQIKLRAAKADDEWMCSYKILRSNKERHGGITSGWVTEDIAKNESLKRAKDWIDSNE